MKLLICIESDSSDCCTRADVLELAHRKILELISTFDTSEKTNGKIQDPDGNTVGQWDLDLDSDR